MVFTKISTFFVDTLGHCARLVKVVHLTGHWSRRKDAAFQPHRFRADALHAKSLLKGRNQRADLFDEFFALFKVDGRRVCAHQKQLIFYGLVLNGQ